MQIFELTQPKRLTIKEYDPDRSPTKPNYGTGVGPGVKTQMTATPTVGAAPTAAVTGNTVNQADPANPNIAAQTPYVQGRAGQGANPTRFAKYDPSTSAMANLDQGMQAMTAQAPAPANPNFGTGVGPGVKPQMTATPTVKGSSAMTPAPAPAPAPTPERVAAAPSTPGVKGSKMGAIVGALGNRLMASNAARVGLSVPDTGDDNAYGDQRAAAAKAAAPLISQQAQEEMTKWNQAISTALQQNGGSSTAQLPAPVKQALAQSLMNQVYTNFLQGRLGKEYRKLPEYVNGKATQQAASQVAKLDNAIKAILNFNAPKSAPAAELQRWQDLSQSAYDMRSLLQYYPKNVEHGAGKKMPVITVAPGGTFKIGNYSLNATDTLDKLIGGMISDQSKNGKLPTISMSTTGRYQIGNHELNIPTGAEQKASKILKQQTDALNTASATESLTWSRSFDPSATLLEKIKQL